MSLLARYGSPSALRRMRAIYESQTEHCQPELLAYFDRRAFPESLIDAVFGHVCGLVRALPTPT